ncbi:AraC family transcriptional regulator [Methylocella silvestris]|uniref:AraC family transcriptional regulator n=1 Tax=Methylocella silvestris TaxID=199596 RepID=A0A2J7TGE0_METSI|nr:AraC family transcriptional regulator [Methylocella silvestris]PNG25837.1 AraC family transcriptional regulator [Methylocella silvestris]
MTAYALTRASTIGPVADEIERAGGSLARVFRRSELPVKLIEKPDQLILLRDQFRLIENAAREIGDESLPARLSIHAGLAGLGPYGRHFMSFSRLGAAISEGVGAFAELLQAATRMQLAVNGRWAKWSYSITEPIVVGRQKNELLALGYMIDLLRCYAGKGWAPDHLELPGATLQAKADVEAIFGCSLKSGPAAAVIFPAELLQLPNPRPDRKTPGDDFLFIPAPDDFLSCVSHVLLCETLAGRPSIHMVARRFGLPPRTLQRKIAERGATFESMLRATLLRQASVFLNEPDLSIADLAYELGYSDPAHFTRAFRNWTGMSPRDWRRRRLIESGPPEALSDE